MNILKSSLILLTISNTLFLVLFLILSWHNELAFDDFHFLWSVNEYGILGTTEVEYLTWSTRWAAVTLIGIILTIHQATGLGLFLFGVLGLSVFISSIYLVIRNIGLHLGIVQKVESNMRFWVLANISVFIVSVIFLGTFKIDETWFLFVSSCVYLWTAIMLILGVGWIINPKRSLWLACLGFLSFVYIGGSLGPLALIVLLVLLVCLIKYRKASPLESLSPRDFQLRLVVALIGCGTAFTILYFGPGNRFRESFFEEISVGYAFVLNVKMTGIIFLKRLPHVLPLIVILCLPVICIGASLEKRKEQLNWKRQLLWLTISYGLIIYLYQLSITYKTQDVGAYRALFPITIFTIGYFCWAYIIVGRSLRLDKRILKFLIMVPLAAGVILFGYHVVTQQKIVTEYSRSYQERMSYLKEEAGQGGVLELTPLSPSGMLFTAEVTADTSHFINQHLKKGLNLSYSVVAKRSVD